MAGQQIMTVNERLKDVQSRWIDQRIEKGLKPRVDQDVFEKAEENIKKVAGEIFDALGVTDQDFIEKHKLNSDESEMRWERFLRRWQAESREDRAKELVKALIG